MHTNTLFASEDLERIQADFPFQNLRKPLQWEGLAYRLAVTDPAFHEIIEAAVMTRRNGSILEYGLTPPVVVRYAYGTHAEDYVFYGTLTDDSAIEIYEHDRVIDDVGYYLYGDWPFWQSRVLPGGFGHIIGILEAVTGTEFTDVSRKFETTRHFNRLERIPLESMGTAPYQPALPV